MIAKVYQEILKNELNLATYHLVVLLVSSLQLLRQVKLELLAEALPLPILFESRRKKLQRFLRLDDLLSIERLWWPCLRAALEENFNAKDRLYVAMDRTSWGEINILITSVICDGRAWPVYWEFLDKKGNSNLQEQKSILDKSFEALSGYEIVVLADREFHSVDLGKYINGKQAYFCLRQKCDCQIAQTDEQYKELRELGLVPGMKVFINDCKVTQSKGFGPVNVACKWKRNYRGFSAKEPWYILTNFPDLDSAISAYQKRFDIEEMFRDFKSGGYSLEGSGLCPKLLSRLMIIVAIAYTSATLQGRIIKSKNLQKYIARPETYAKGQRRHSSFYIGQHLHHWLRLQQLCQQTLDELLQINRRWLNFYKKGQRAIELALSTF